MNSPLFPQLEPLREEMERGPGVISFTVYGIARPQNKLQTKVRYRKGADGRATPVTDPKTGRVLTYTHQTDELTKWREHVRSVAAEVSTGRLIDGAVELRCVFFLPRPGRLIWKTRPMPTEPAPTRPDLDNLIKAVKDALKGVVWRDDQQVCRLVAEKRYNPGPGYGDERARVEVRVEAIS
jgi:Holliday junction resolvase RusA-like endonuclease